MTQKEQSILIVDDKPANLFALEQTLSTLGVRIVKAENGNDALARTLEHEFALCILDVQMPDLSGFQVAEILRGDPKTKYTPIICLIAAGHVPLLAQRG